MLDEATAHLDSESEAAVQRALRETLSGRTSLVIAHRLSTVREADQLLVIDDGRVVERGTHASLLADSGLYAELYQTQFADQESRKIRFRRPRRSKDQDLHCPVEQPLGRRGHLKHRIVLLLGEGLLAALITLTSARSTVHNELCDRLGIEFPIFAFTHCRDVAAAVSNAGGMGVLGAVGFALKNSRLS